MNLGSSQSLSLDSQEAKGTGDTLLTFCFRRLAKQLHVVVMFVQYSDIAVISVL